MVYAMGTKRRAVVALPASAKARAGKLLRACTGDDGAPVVSRDEDEGEIAKRNKGKVFFSEDGGDTWSVWTGA